MNSLSRPAYRSALQRPAPHIFSVPLLQQAAQVYSYLAKANELKDLDQITQLGYAIYSRYMLFIYILKDHLQRDKTMLVPPLDGAS